MRYRAARDEAQASGPKPIELDGKTAANYILGSEFADSGYSVDEKDPLGLREGVEVEVYAADWGSEYRDRGRLVGLTPDEAVVAVTTKDKGEIRIHAPRTGFKIEETGGH